MRSLAMASREAPARAHGRPLLTFARGAAPTPVGIDSRSTLLGAD
jgi:hypothetical protein